MSDLHNLEIASANWATGKGPDNETIELGERLRACRKCCETCHDFWLSLVSSVEKDPNNEKARVRLAFFADVIESLMRGANALVAEAEATTVPYGVESDLTQVKICIAAFADALRRDDLAQFLSMREKRPIGARPGVLDEDLRDDIIRLMNEPIKPMSIRPLPMPDIDPTTFVRRP